MSADSGLLGTSSLTPPEVIYDTLICDIETYRNFFLVAFKRLSDGKVIMLEMSDRKTLDRDRLRAIITSHRIVTFNGLSYDMPLIWYAIEGADNASLKRASDRIIQTNIRYWEIERELGIRIPKIDHIDIIEPQPNPVISLKGLNGRLHGRHMQDLPIDPDETLTHEQMDLLRKYCGNDLDATELVWDALEEPMALRETLSAQYGMDFRSKSDSQIGEAIIRKRVEQMTGQRIERMNGLALEPFRYKIPDFVKFERPELQQLVERLRETEFEVAPNGKVQLPKWLEGLKFTIGNTTYAMGIGGLHSTESERAVHADHEHELIDADVASQYPSIILNLGLYPKAVGPAFLEVYRAIYNERLAAKDRAKVLKKIAKRTPEEQAELERCNATDKGLKIALNGVYGKLGSGYSFLFAPHLMIAVTLTGQLSLLMIAEQAEKRGIPVVSANTDGVLFRCPKAKRAELDALCAEWEAATDFKLEFADYRSIYNESVNSYIVIKTDGSSKRKGPLANPWAEGDLRGMMTKNPQMTIISDAVTKYLTDFTPIADTIRGCTDIRSFITVVRVTGGGTWRGEYLGKNVRYYWTKGGTEILYAKAHETTGNFKKVSKTDGCRPIMTLPDELPDDIDYERYIAEAHEVLMNIGAKPRPPVAKPVRIYKYNWKWWLALTL